MTGFHVTGPGDDDVQRVADWVLDYLAARGSYEVDKIIARSTCFFMREGLCERRALIAAYTLNAMGGAYAN